MKHIIIVLMLIVLSHESFSQGCAMCVEALESNIEAGGTQGSGINNAIIYLMATPYLAMLIFGGLWYIQNRKGLKN